MSATFFNKMVSCVGTRSTRSTLESNQDKLECKECNEEVRKQERGTRKELGVFDRFYMVSCQLRSNTDWIHQSRVMATNHI